MNTQQLKRYCRKFPGAAERLLAHPGNVLIYSVGGKSFAYFKTSQPEKWRFSIRVASDLFLGLTDVPGIKPARYMGRFYWITIVKVEDMPGAYLKELVRGSYDKALSSLSKARRAAAIGATQSVQTAKRKVA